MKKNKLLIFMLCLVVCASFVLAACDQGTPVYAAISWEDSESYVFDVSLALKTTDSGYSIEHDDKTFANNSEMLADTGIYDQFRPSSISGTMTYDISTSGAVQTFETVQYIECTYLSADLELFEALKTHVDGLQGDDRDIVLESTSSKIVLSSHTQTTVKFKKVFQQTPVSSQTVVKGFYAGRLHFEVNDYTISTVYEANTATVTKTERGQKVIDGEVRTLSTAQYIDAAQLLLYQRSLDQRAAWTQTPSVDVYDATSDRMLTFSFALGLKTPVILPNMNANNNLAVVNSVGVSTALSLQNAYVFICFNNPNDTKLSDAGEVNKNTQVKFQSGFMLYELSAYTAEQISDLAYVAGTDD